MITVCSCASPQVAVLFANQNLFYGRRKLHSSEDQRHSTKENACVGDELYSKYGRWVGLVLGLVNYGCRRSSVQAGRTTLHSEQQYQSCRLQGLSSGRQLAVWDSLATSLVNLPNTSTAAQPYTHILKVTNITTIIIFIIQSFPHNLTS